MSEQVKHTPALKGCPFCGSIPKFIHGKKTYCSLHGDESQTVIVKCTNSDCVSRPKVETGDIYNGGLDLAKQEAFEKWNKRVWKFNHDSLEAKVEGLLEAAKDALEILKRQPHFEISSSDGSKFNSLKITKKLEKAISKAKEE